VKIRFASSALEARHVRGPWLPRISQVPLTSCGRNTTWRRSRVGSKESTTRASGLAGVPCTFLSDHSNVVHKVWLLVSWDRKDAARREIQALPVPLLNESVPLADVQPDDIARWARPNPCPSAN